MFQDEDDQSTSTTTTTTATKTTSSDTDNAQADAQLQTQQPTSTTVPTLERQDSVKKMAHNIENPNNNDSSSRTSDRKSKSIKPGLVAQRKGEMQDNKQVNEITLPSNVRPELEELGNGTVTRLRETLVNGNTGSSNSSDILNQFSERSIDEAKSGLSKFEDAVNTVIGSQTDLNADQEFESESTEEEEEEEWAPPPRDSLSLDFVPAPPPSPPPSPPTKATDVNISNSSSNTTGLTQTTTQGGGRGAPLNRGGAQQHPAVSELKKKESQREITFEKGKQLPTHVHPPKPTHTPPPPPAMATKQQPIIDIKDTVFYKLHMRFVTEHWVISLSGGFAGSGGRRPEQLKEFAEIYKALNLPPYSQSKLFKYNAEVNDGQITLSAPNKVGNKPFGKAHPDLNIRLKQYEFREAAPSKEGLFSKYPPYFQYRDELLALSSEQIKEQLDVYSNWINYVIKPALKNPESSIKLAGKPERYEEVIEAISDPKNVVTNTIHNYLY